MKRQQRNNKEEIWITKVVDGDLRKGKWRKRIQQNGIREPRKRQKKKQEPSEGKYLFPLKSR